MSTLKNQNPNLNAWTKYHALVTYATHEELVRCLELKRPEIVGCAYIHHESDEDNTFPHFHIAIALNRTARVSTIRGWFKTAVDENSKSVTTLGQPVRSFLKLHEYFMHVDEDSKQKGKHEYTENDIKVLNEIPSPWHLRAVEDHEIERAEKKEQNADECERMLQDIIDGVSSREMARRYGRDYMKNHSKYREFAACVVLEETGNIDIAQRINGVASPFLNKVSNESYVRGFDSAVSHFVTTIDTLVENGCFSSDVLKKILDGGIENGN